MSKREEIKKVIEKVGYKVKSVDRLDDHKYIIRIEIAKLENEDIFFNPLNNIGFEVVDAWEEEEDLFLGVA